MAAKRQAEESLETPKTTQKAKLLPRYGDLQSLVPEDWAEALDPEFQKPYWADLCQKLETEAATESVFPPAEDVFAALKHTPLNNVRVVVIGQDPYHGAGQAHGLCFSVRPGVKIPPSLTNIYKELSTEFETETPSDGNLLHWADQGVLMLNNVLTVRAHSAGSHSGWGWEQFTDAIVSFVNNRLEGVVFLLWGSKARSKCSGIDTEKHHVLCSPHPSPLSAYRGFFGNGHFKETNRLLEQRGTTPIDWI